MQGYAKLKYIIGTVKLKKKMTQYCNVTNEFIYMYSVYIYTTKPFIVLIILSLELFHCEENWTKRFEKFLQIHYKIEPVIRKGLIYL